MKMNKLAMLILEYESDTFSADGTNLTKPELKLMLDKIYESIIEDIDGVWLSQMLAEIRDVDEIEDLYDVLEKKGDGGEHGN